MSKIHFQHFFLQTHFDNSFNVINLGFLSGLSQLCSSSVFVVASEEVASEQIVLVANKTTRTMENKTFFLDNLNRRGVMLKSPSQMDKLWHLGLALAICLNCFGGADTTTNDDDDARIATSQWSSANHGWCDKRDSTESQCLLLLASPKANHQSSLHMVPVLCRIRIE